MPKKTMPAVKCLIQDRFNCLCTPGFAGPDQVAFGIYSGAGDQVIEVDEALLDIPPMMKSHHFPSEAANQKLITVN